MKQYQVEGMSCAACSARVESAVSKLPGVTACSVNLLTKSMTVEGSAGDDVILAAVEKAGYSASLKGEEKKASAPPKEKAENTLKLRLTISVILTIILMYFSMGHTMWGFPVPRILENPVALGLIQLVLAGLIMVINQRFFISGFRGVLNKSPNMDTLVSMGSGVSFLYSLGVLFLMIDAHFQGNTHAAMGYLHDLYFESAAMILTIITIGKLLEEHAKGKTTNAIASLIELAPKTAIKLVDGTETEVPIEELRSGDLFVVKPGGSIPADGIIRQGESAINESALTGESIPVDKTLGDSVSAATINLSGHLVCEATGVGENTALAKIIEMVSQAASTKAPIAKVANQVSAVFVPAVLGIALITLAIWLLVGETFGFALARGISVLVVSCPCALGLATPVAIMVGNGVGARCGILFKTAESLEETGKAKIVVLDKTGTITAGTPEVTDVFAENPTELLKIAYALETKSEHPLGKAIVRYGEEQNLSKAEVEQFRILPGNGLTGTIDGKTVFGGNLTFAKTFGEIPPSLLQKAEVFSGQGKTPLFFGLGTELLGIIAVADTIKETSIAAVSQLKEMGVRVVMLTGDNQKTADAIAKQVGIDHVVAGVLPDGKQSVVADLKKDGKVIMVGDGINDAPALTSADIGIAIGTGTDIAIEAADVVLMKNTLTDVPAAIRLSRSTLKNIRQNLFWAFCYNIIGIPLAAGAFIPLWNIRLNPMFGAIAMCVSDFLVVTNALRLNLCNLYSKKQNVKEVISMEKTFKVEGMMCPHCEARVTEKLLELPGVSNVVASHQNKTVVVTLENDVPDAVITETITAQGYQVL